MAAPARSDPVSDTPCTLGSVITEEICSWEANRVVYPAAGNPASVSAFRMISSVASAEVGTDSACLSRTVLPTSRFGAANRAIW